LSKDFNCNGISGTARGLTGRGEQTKRERFHTIGNIEHPTTHAEHRGGKIEGRDAEKGGEDENENYDEDEGGIYGLKAWL
jgi:hypothetical protein